ncbi:hypothetical protein [Pseudooceanicola sp.]|uniref:hypothetical protein n=1 Tax=Pseudooceanicola sp. TaxID=1914328 RepID=UPI00351129AF
MKRAIGVDASDRLNFFRLYDGCLMDEAAISWCKLFGSPKESLHWERLFPQSATTVRPRLECELRASVDNLDDLSKSLRNYRDTYVAHHDLSQTKRAKSHPKLEPLRKTGWILYREIHNVLSDAGQDHGLPEPLQINGQRLKEIERHWQKVSNAARAATKEFSDCPD